MLGVFVAVLMIIVLVVMHELGHYGMARLLKVEVKEFAIGFGKKLWGFVSRRSGIAYSVRLVPFGGYTEYLTEYDVAGHHGVPVRHFEEEPVWKRLLIVLAGPAMNLLLALVLSTGLWFVQEVGDHYRAFADEAVAPQYDMQSLWEAYNTASDWDVRHQNLFIAGVEGVAAAMQHATESPGNALETVGGWLTSVVGLGALITENGADLALKLMISCSVSLGLFNLLPIPGLDGSWVLLLLLELARGKKLSAFWQSIYEWASLGAVGVLLLCMGINDVITVVKLVFPAV